MLPLPRRFHFFSLPLASVSLAALATAALLFFTTVAAAQNHDPAPTAAEQEVRDAFDALLQNAQPGPRDITLGNQAVLKLPEGFYFADKLPASRLMRAIGNIIDDNFYGLVLHDQISGFVTIDFTPSGYIKDDDARDWDAKKLLDNLKEGTEQGNQERVQRGIPPIEVIGWVEPPAYDAATHRLVWSASLREKGISAGSNGKPADQGVNYNTFLLGREGFLSLNLVTSLAAVEPQKPLARQLLSSTSFNDGKRYEDFNAGTDHVAEYGLAALVGGIAAKKLGLLAAFGVFFVKFWKLLLIGFVAIGAVIRKFFGLKKNNGS